MITVIREYQALQSCHTLTLLPNILKPTAMIPRINEVNESKFSVLKDRYNSSQIEAIKVLFLLIFLSFIGN